jgi:hypothetical protein
MQKRAYKAQQIVEIAVIASLVVVICLAGLYYFGESIKSVFEDNPIFSAFSSSDRTNVFK